MTRMAPSAGSDADGGGGEKLDDAAIIGWAHPSYPPPIQALQRRLSPSGAARVDTGPGWWPLLQRLNTELRAIDPGYRLTRVGESFGELVFDAVTEVAPPARDVFERAIGAAWDESSRTCENCGHRATLWRQEDWFVTLCVEHARTRGSRLPGTEETFDDIVARPLTPPAVACLSASTVTPASVMDARAWAEERLLERDERVRRWLNIGDMAWRLRVTPDAMRQLRRAGRVCATLGPDRRLRFPIWQLAPGGGLLRGLTEVLGAVGAGVDAVALTDVMTAASGALEGVSVVQWLAGGGDMDVALRLVRVAGRV